MFHESCFSDLIFSLGRGIRDDEENEDIQMYIANHNIPVLDLETQEKVLSKYSQTKSINSSLEFINTQFSITADALKQLLTLRKRVIFKDKILLLFTSYFSLGLSLISERPVRSDIIMQFTLFLTYFNSKLGEKMIHFIYNTIIYNVIEHSYPEMTSKCFLTFLQFCNISLRSSEKSFTQLSSIMKHSIEKGNNEFVNHISSILVEMINCLGSNEIKFDYTDLIDAIGLVLDGFNESIIVLLFKLATFCQSIEIEVYLNKFVQNVFKLTGDKYKFLPSADFNELNQEIQRKQDISIENPTIEFEKLNPKSDFTFTSILFTDKTFSPLELKISAQNIQNFYKNSIIATINSCMIGQANPEKYIAFLFLVEIFNVDLTDELFCYITCDEIFDQTVSIFNCAHDDFTLFLRNQSIISIFHSNSEYFAIFIKQMLGAPLLFSEILLFLSNSIEKFDKTVLISNILLEAIQFHCKYIESLIHKLTNQGHVKALNLAKSSTFFYIFKLFDQFHECINSKFYVDICVFATSVSPDFRLLFLPKLGNLLNSQTDESFAINYIENSLSTANNYSNEVGVEIVGILADTVSLNSSLAAKCVCLLESIVKFVQRMKTARNLLTCLSLLSSVLSSTDYSMNNDMIHDLTQMIIEIGPSAETDAIKQRSLILLSGYTSYQGNPGFLIKRPNLILMIFSIFSHFNKIHEYLYYLTRLCDYSYYNKLKIQETGLDILLLDLFINFPNDFVFRSFSIKNFKDKNELFKVIPFLCLLMSTKSNLCVAEKIMNIICPNDSMKISEIGQEFATVIIPKITKMQDEPSFFLPIADNAEYLVINDVKFQEFVNGSTLSFWLFFDGDLQSKNNFKADIFRVFLGKDIFLHVWIEENSIMAKVNQKSRLTILLLTKELTMNSWNFISLSLCVNQKMLDISIFINHNQSFENSIAWEDDRQGNLTFRIGNSFKNIGDRIDLLSTFMLGPTTLYGSMLPKYAHKNLCANEMMEIDAKTPVLFSYPKNSQHNIKFAGSFDGCINSSPSVFQVFRNIYPLQIIAPVLRYFDKLPQMNQFLFLDIMKHFYGFVIWKFFPIIPNFLYTQDPSVLTYSLYQRFFMFAESCNDNQYLDSLYENLLFNFELWIRSPYLQRVCQHWANNLFQTYEFFRQKDFIQKTISKIRKYFYFEEKEKDIISSTKRDPRTNIKKCRESLDRILIEHCIKVATSNDLDFIFISAAQCKDLKQSQQFLLLGIEFAKSVYPTVNSLKALYYIAENNSELIEYVLKAIVAISPEEEIHQNLSRLCWKRINFISVELMKSIPQIYFLCLQAALINDNEDYRKEILSEILSILDDKFVSYLKKQKWWMLWPIIFYSNFKHYECPQLTRFIYHIIDKDTSLINKCLDLFDIIQTITNVDLVKHKAQILLPLICNHKDENIIKCCFDTLYLTNSFSEELIEEFEKNIFEEKILQKKIISCEDFLELETTDIACKFNIHHKYTEGDMMNNIFIMYSNTFSKKLDFKSKIIGYTNSNEETKSDILHFLNSNLSEINLITTNRNNELINTLNELKFIIIQKPRTDFVFNTKIFEELELESRNNLKEFEETWSLINRDHIHSKSLWKDSDNFILDSSFRTTPLFYPTRLKRVKANKYIGSEMIPEFIENSFPQSCVKCIKITQKGQTEGMFELHKKYFTIFFKAKKKIYSFMEIRHILMRNETRIEFFSVSGQTLLLDFSPIKNSEIMSKLSMISIPNLIFFQNIPGELYMKKIGLEKRLQNGYISNLQFIILSNMFNNRSFNNSSTKVLLPFDTDPKLIFTPEIFDDFEKSFNLRDKINEMKIDEVLNFTKDLICPCEQAQYHVLNASKHQNHLLSEDVWNKFPEWHFLSIIPEKKCLTCEVDNFFKIFDIDDKIIYISHDSIYNDGQIIKIEGFIDDAVEVSGKTIAINKALLEISIISDNVCKTEKMNDLDIVRSDKELVAIATMTGIIEIYHSHNFSSPLYILRVFSDSIADFAISCDHGIIAVATYDGYVSVYDLRSTRLILATKVSDDQITKIIITKDYGFIVVFAYDSISVLTANGKLVTSTKAKFNIKNACTFSLGGYDFVVFGKHNSKVLYFVAGELSISFKEFISIDCDIIDLIYSNEKRCVVLATSDSIINYYPISYFV